MKCDCKHCKYAKELKYHLEVLRIYERYEQIQFFQNMYDTLCCEQMDNDYHKAILDGSWPNAKEVLEEALRRIK